MMERCESTSPFAYRCSKMIENVRLSYEPAPASDFG